MTDITPYDVIPADAAVPEPARPRLLLLATALTSGGLLVGYASLLGHYLSRRASVIATGERWLPDGVDIPLTQPNFMMLTLAMSTVSMLWALSAVRHDDRANAYPAFGITLVFGFSQIIQTAFLLDILEMPIAGSERAALIFTLVGVQLVVMAVAMGYVALVALRTLGGGCSARDFEGVLAATVFWFVAVGLYSALWYAVYITK
jgi:heme/copper-type cytochrome/quinol oxidase subunit 3